MVILLLSVTCNRKSSCPFSLISDGHPCLQGVSHPPGDFLHRPWSEQPEGFPAGELRGDPCCTVQPPLLLSKELP